MRKILSIAFITACVFCFIYVTAKKHNLKNTLVSLEFPSYDQNYPPPPGTKDVFELSQNYPLTYNEHEIYPWQAIDFKVEPERYMQVVLEYCLEGNLEVDFVVQNNKKRSWYHAPWLHDDGRVGGNGREYLHGLTRELATPKYKIHKDQDVELENWAIGFYNAPGGYTMGKVWETGKPNIMNSIFPEGTATFKLLFTDGDADKVPYLRGTKEWTANIYPCHPRMTPPKCPNAQKRVNRTVRLIQIDIAVKDKRAESTGWVFGTFIYDASKGDQLSWWQKLVPVGLSWGDDSKVIAYMKKDGAFINPHLQESFINKDLMECGVQDEDKAYVRFHGLGGRLNGPVDNPISSCVSCHGRAAVSLSGEQAATGNFNLTRGDFDRANFDKYFSNIGSGVNKINLDGKDYFTTDYSLQLATGIKNYFKANLSIPFMLLHHSAMLTHPGIDRPVC